MNSRKQRSVPLEILTALEDGLYSIRLSGHPWLLAGVAKVGLPNPSWETPSLEIERGESRDPSGVQSYTGHPPKYRDELISVV